MSIRTYYFFLFLFKTLSVILVENVAVNTIIKSYAHAESELIKAKLMYNNLDRYLSVRQTEVKRDLTLAGKQDV